MLAVLKFSNCKNFRYLKKKWIIAFQNSNPSKNCKNPCCFQAHDLQIFNWLDKETVKENGIIKQVHSQYWGIPIYVHVLYLFERNRLCSNTHDKTLE